MKKFLLTISILLLSLTPILAQTEEEVTTTEEEVTTTEEESSNAYFDLRLERGTQNPLNKEIPYTLYITPKIDSPKTQILWDVPLVFELTEKHSEFVSLVSGTTYSYKVSLKPEREGTYNIAANVISWQYDTNKSNTVEDIIELNGALVVQPIDAQYTLTILIIVLAVLLLSGISIFVLIKVVKKSVVKLRKWLTPPF